MTCMYIPITSIFPELQIFWWPMNSLPNNHKGYALTSMIIVWSLFFKRYWFHYMTYSVHFWCTTGVENLSSISLEEINGFVCTCAISFSDSKPCHQRQLGHIKLLWCNNDTQQIARGSISHNRSTSYV